MNFSCVFEEMPSQASPETLSVTREWCLKHFWWKILSSIFQLSSKNVWFHQNPNDFHRFYLHLHDVFVYNSAAIEWVDGEELDPISPPYYDRQIIKITGSERKEYFVEVTPTVAAKDYLVENKKYDVQADGSFVEINRQLTNGEIEGGGSIIDDLRFQ